MAAKQPDKKNIRVVNVGTPRNIVLAEWGVPVSTQVREDKHRVDIYSFKQGYSNLAKFGRAALHTVASAATLGAWEIIGTPAEVAFDGKYVAFQIIYNEQDIAISVTRLK